MVGFPPPKQRPGAVVVCIPVDELDNPLEGSTKVECNECSRIVWLTPAVKVASSKHPPVEYLCAPCGSRLGGPMIVVVPTDPEELADLIRKMAGKPKPEGS